MVPDHVGVARFGGLRLVLVTRKTISWLGEGEGGTTKGMLWCGSNWMELQWVKADLSRESQEGKERTVEG